MHKVDTFDPLPHEDFADLARRFLPRQAVDGQAGKAVENAGSVGLKWWFSSKVPQNG